MNTKKMVGIICIWILAAFGWFVLGATLLGRSGEFTGRLSDDVARLWGDPQVQAEPTVSKGASITRSDITVDIDTENRQRGLLWFPVYHVRFTGVYTVTNTGDAAQSATLDFRLPESTAEFQKQTVMIADQAAPQWTESVRTPNLTPGESCAVTFSYESQGTDNWKYDLPDDEMIADLTLTVRINRPDYDFDAENPDSSPPTVRNLDPDSEDKYVLVWNKQQVTNARDVVIQMPKRQQPGPLAGRISFFAPVSLLFFFVVMIAIQVVKKLSLHPMHYLFLAGAFFAFHLLLAYMVDHVALQASFWISAAVSVVLVVMYLWLVAGPKAAILYAGLSQLIYLILFSYSFFLKGFTGLTVTIGAVMTLGVLMILTARVRWGEALPELESRRRPGWAPVSPPPGKGDMPGFVGESGSHDDRPPSP